MILTQILLGSLAIALGIVGLKYNYQLVGFTGHIGWVERYLGGGSTYGFVKLLSVLLILAGIIYMTGLHKPVLDFLLAPLIQMFPKI
ncbi:MAG TPA: hypothetical protein VNA68_02470 [Candidatus Dormibacteraeota bacterium]|nr:hypothetical protein [Candidatus Dormibacteraeota bacterium]